MNLNDACFKFMENMLEMLIELSTLSGFAEGKYV